MFERFPPVRRFDEMLADSLRDKSEIRRRSSPYLVGDASDSAERRADEVADRGLLTLQAAQSRLPSAAAAPVAPGSRLQRSANGSQVGLRGGPVDESLSSELDGAIGRGRRFESDVQRSIRRATGHDVSDVSVHTDARADRLARSMQASAFTADRNVFFASGQYRPDTDDGMHTVLHESAHLAEGACRVQRRTIRRRVAVTTQQFEQSFGDSRLKRAAGDSTGLGGIANKMMGGGEIAKIRDALKSYHVTKPGSPQEQAALESLLVLGDKWLRKHPRALSRSDQSRMELIDSIRTQAGMEFAKLQASAIYVGDGAAKANKTRPDQLPASGPGANPFQAMAEGPGFRGGACAERADTDSYLNMGAKKTREDLVAAGQLKPTDPATEAAMTAALESLTEAEYAALHTYTADDYKYINTNVGGRGGRHDKAVDKAERSLKARTAAGLDPELIQGAASELAKHKAAQKAEREESAMHAGFMGEAFRKLPIWTGTSYRGVCMSSDYLGLTDGKAYKAHDYWSTTEAKSISQGFIEEYCAGKHMAALCTIKVVNGRDISRISAASVELEILLPPGSIYKIGKRVQLLRGKDDDRIKALFGEGVFNKKHITEFWTIELTQQFSGDGDVAGAYKTAGLWNKGKDAKRPEGPQKDVYPWDLMGGRRMLYH